MSNVGSLHFVAVLSSDGEVHAGINRRVHGRFKLALTTLCSRMDELVATGIAGADLSDVECGLCRAQLLDDGVID